ncbi:MAG: sortase [Bacilli bacterium]
MCNLENISDHKIEKQVLKNIIPIKKQSTYIGLLEIPKIALKKEIIDINSKDNHVDKNIQTISLEANNYILAAHNGNTANSYFKNLDKLRINDYIYLYYNNKKYTYLLYDIYEVKKLGFIKLKIVNQSIITLITCKKNNNYLQVIYVGILQKEEIN